MSAFSWENANNFTSPLRRFAASILNIITQFLLDDPLVIPAPADPKGTPILADFNGDGRTDLLVQPPNGTGTVYLFLVDINGKYTIVSQSWSAAFLSLAWGKDASTLYAGNGVRHTKTRTTNNINAKGRSKSTASSFIEWAFLLRNGNYSPPLKNSSKST